MARTILLTILGNSRSGERAMRRTADEADNTADSIDRLNLSSRAASAASTTMTRSLTHMSGRLAATTKTTAKAALAVGSVAATAASAAPAVAAATAAVIAYAKAVSGAAPALAAFAVAGGFLKLTLRQIFKEGSAAVTALKPLAEGFNQAGQAASRAAAKGIGPLAAQLNRVAMPVVERTMVRIGTAAGRVQTEFGRWAASTQGVKTLKDILDPIGASVQRLAPNITRVAISFTRMLGRIMGVSLAAGTSGLANVLDLVADKLDRINAGTVSQGLDRIKRSFEFVVTAAKTVGRWIGTVVTAYRMYTTQFRAVADAVSVAAVIFGGPVIAITAGIGLIIRHFDQFKAAYERLKASLASPPATGFIAGLRAAADRELPRLRRVLSGLGADFTAFGRSVGPPLVAFFQRFWAEVRGPLEEVYHSVTQRLLPAFGGLVRALGPLAAFLARTLGPLVAASFGNMLRVVRGVLDIVAGVFKIFTGILTGDWHTMWQGITSILGGAGAILGAAVRQVWAIVTAVFRGNIGLVVGYVRGLVRLVVNLVRVGLGGGALKAAVANPLGAVVGIFTRTSGVIRSVTGGMLGWVLSRVRVGLVAVRQAFVAATTAVVSFVTGRWRALQQRTAELMGWLLGKARQGLANIRGVFASQVGAIFGVVRAGWSRVQAATTGLASQLTSRVRSLMSTLRAAFATGVQAIGRAWHGLEAVAKKPVNFMIGTVYNKGIVGLWNTVIGWLHLNGLRLGKIAQLARGGTLANPATARPMTTRGPMAIVGEGRTAYPEYVIPTDPRYRGRARGLWAAAGGDLQMLKAGGVIGSVLGGVKNFAGKVVGLSQFALDLLTNPSKIWERLAAPVLNLARGITGGPWGEAIRAIPNKLLSTVGSAAMQIIKAFNSGYGGDPYGVVKAAEKYIGVGDSGGNNDNYFNRRWSWPAGTPWCANFVSTAIADAKAHKRYPGWPTASVAIFDSSMKHVGTHEGRPGDLGVYRGDEHINVIARRLGAGRIYETIGGNEGPTVKRDRRGGQTSMLRPMAHGGLLGGQLGASRRERGVFGERNLDPADRSDPLLRIYRTQLFDRGGWLQPGVTLAVNRTGKPERVSPHINPRTVPNKPDGPGPSRPGAGGPAGHALPDVVKAIQGLLDQLAKTSLNTLEKVRDFARKTNEVIRKNFSGGAEKRLLAWAGRIQQSMTSVAKRSEAIAAKIAQAREFRASTTQSAKEFAALSGLGAGNAKDVLTGLTSRAGQLRKFSDLINKLAAKGLSRGLLSQIIAMGPGAEGMGLAEQLLRADTRTFAKINQAQAGIDKAAFTFGRRAADALFDSGKGAAKGFLTGLLGEQERLGKLMDRLSKRLAAGLRRQIEPPAKPRTPKPRYNPRKLVPVWSTQQGAEPILAGSDVAAYGTARSPAGVNQYFTVYVADKADVDMVMNAAEFRARTL